MSDLFTENWLAERLILWIPLVLSLTVHEWAHAWSANLLGDDTARHLGRMSLNPLVHLDPIGSVLLPLAGVPFGWAKPVPVNPSRITRVRSTYGHMIVAAAGPISNLLLAAISAGILMILARNAPEVLRDVTGLAVLLQIAVFLNVILALFNLLPIPPLDGSYIANALMPASLRGAWHKFCALGPVFLVAVIALPHLTGVSLFDYPIKLLQRFLVYLTA